MSGVSELDPGLKPGWVYKYKENSYTVVSGAKMKIGQVWLPAVVYSNKEGLFFVREQGDFIEKFKPVKP